MIIEGYIYYDGKCYDDDGHCDEFDLMFCRSDTGGELCLNDFAKDLFPQGVVGDSFMGPMSINDKMHVKLHLDIDKLQIIYPTIAIPDDGTGGKGGKRW